MDILPLALVRTQPLKSSWEACTVGGFLTFAFKTPLHDFHVQLFPGLEVERKEMIP